jgi:biotin carboxyl carrier protein
MSTTYENEVPLPDGEWAGGNRGEHLSVRERVVISPTAGVFSPVESDWSGAHIEVGTMLGTIASHSVRSPFSGSFMGMLAHRGERVQIGQPIAWLRTDEAA